MQRYFLSFFLLNLLIVTLVPGVTFETYQKTNNRSIACKLIVVEENDPTLLLLTYDEKNNLVPLYCNVSCAAFSLDYYGWNLSIPAGTYKISAPEKFHQGTFQYWFDNATKERFPSGKRVITLNILEDRCLIAVYSYPSEGGFFWFALGGVTATIVGLAVFFYWRRRVKKKQVG